MCASSPPSKLSYRVAGLLSGWLAATVLLFCMTGWTAERDRPAEPSGDAAGAHRQPIMAAPPTPLAPPLPSTAKLSDGDGSRARPSQQRAFRFSEDATRDAVRGIWIVATIGLAGVILIFAGSWYFYAPKAWQQRYQPTPVLKLPDEQRQKIREHYASADRYDLEGELGDYLKTWDDPPRPKRPPR